MCHPAPKFPKCLRAALLCQPKEDRMNRKNREAPTSSESPTDMQAFPIVALGASAGGLEALQEFFDRMPPDSGMAFMIIQHLSAKSKSLLGDLLQKHTRMKVVSAQDRMRIEANCVYLNPADKDVGIFHGVLHMTDPIKTRGVGFPIDHFFRSLAADQGERAICAILSGTGSDGTLGLKAIKEAGGMAIVQDPQEAKYDGMPRSAMETGLVDQILPVERIPQELLSYVKQPYLKGPRRREAEEKQFAGYVQKILMLLRSVTGRDFTEYKQNTIRRRIRRRMAVHKIEHIRDYHRYLQENHGEVHRLFKELLILVTSFFRDPAVFEVLAAKVLPAILADRADGAAVRVWVPGCATGEEAHSLAMLFAEAMEQLNRHVTLQIFATDIDPEAIQRARLAEYPESIGADVSPERLKRFFVKKNGSYRLKSDIRETVVFAVQDLVSDPPFSRLDLVSCRNVLIYMDVPLQKKMLSLFHYTLNDNGYLLLGTSESIGEFSDLYAPVDIKAKVFRPKKALARKVVHRLPAGDAVHGGRMDQDKDGHKAMNVQGLLERIVIDDYAPPCVLVDERYDVLYFQGDIGRVLPYPRGEPTHNILKLIPDPLRHRLATALQKAVRDREPTVFHGAAMGQEEKLRTVDVTVRPVHKAGDDQPLVLIVFADRPAPATTGRKRKGLAGRQTDPRIEELEQELQSTRESLHATIEELEASNEELKSTNEEIQSTNEELQSMNEELETAREELQSTNEELVTVNSELQAKVDELTEVTDDVNNLLASTEIGTIFLDVHLGIKRFTPSMTKLFSLIPTDIGRSLRDFTTKIAYADLTRDAEAVLETLQTKETEVQAEDGRWLSMRILPYRTRENLIDGVVITFVDITDFKRVEEQMLAARIYAESIVETIRVCLLTLDADLKVISANRQFYRTFATTPEETENRRIYDLGNGQWDIPGLRELIERILPEDAAFDEIELEHDFPGVGPKRMLVNARKFQSEGDRPELILIAIDDVTGQTRTEKELRETIRELEKQVEGRK
jgi:two-component system, chemotaxis family, CheB/CheR fusion protein